MQHWTGPSEEVKECIYCEFSLCLHTPPVLLALWGKLVVKRCGTAVDAIGCGGGVVISQSTVRQVQHGAPMESLEVGGGGHARDGY